MKRFDVSVTGQWGLYTIQPHTAKARTWLAREIKNDGDEHTWTANGSLVCEGGDNCRAIVAAMVKESLRVEVNGVNMKGFRAA